MGLYIETVYVDVTDPEHRCGAGEDGIYETQAETPGELFAMLTGRKGFGMFGNVFESMGRCTGRVYVDVPGSPCVLCHKARDEHEHDPQTNRIHVENIEPGGTSEDGRTWPNGAVIPHGHYYQAEARQVGWVFVKREPVEDRRDDDPKTWLREAWVTVHTEPPTVTRTPHYAELRP